MIIVILILGAVAVIGALLVGKSQVDKGNNQGFFADFYRGFLDGLSDNAKSPKGSSDKAKFLDDFSNNNKRK